jgi:hypothetical protein
MLKQMVRVKLSLKQAVNAHRVMRLRGFALYPPGRFMLLISVRGRADPKAIVRLEGLGKKKKNDLLGNRIRDLPACSIIGDE